MSNSEPEIRLISLLYCLARADRPASLAALCRLTSCAPAELRSQLDRLEAAGLVDAVRVRLTLPGLAVAVAASARTRRQTLSAA